MEAAWSYRHRPGIGVDLPPPELTIGLPKQAAARLRKVASLDQTGLILEPALAEMLDWLTELAADLDQWEARIAELEGRLARC